MAFTADSYLSKLAKLSDSQQSIQTLSHWVQYHKKAAADSAAVWAAEAVRVPASRQLLYVYLANDIMQNSRRKGPEFVKAYGDHMPAVLPRIFAAATAAVQAKILRMLGIWEERQVLGVATLNELRARLSASPSSSASAIDVIDDAPAPPAYHSARSAGGAPFAASGGGAAGALPLADLLASFDEGSVVDELQAEREVDLDMEPLQDVQVSEPSELAAVADKAAAAAKLLSAQKEKLVEELRARREVRAQHCAARSQPVAWGGTAREPVPHCRLRNVKVAG